jgi:CheY-like chemotaxis protein
MRRVVVVDDDPDVARALGRLLWSHGFAVRTCVSGHDALGALRALPAETVVSDLMMPGMDGVALLAQVKSEWPQTQRVLVTALADTLDRDRLEPCAPCAVVPKPWREADLLTAVRGGGH